MKIVVLTGGNSGSRFLLGTKQLLGEDHQLTAIVNTADNLWLHGLRICPDLDTCMYALSGVVDPVRGWGRAEETWSIKNELTAYGAEPEWFSLGDKDIATHVMRTRMLRAGFPLSEVTEALCQRWKPGVRLLPMSDDRVETHVVIADPDNAGGQKAIHFQQWWGQYRAKPIPSSIVGVGAEESSPAPGVLDAIAEAEVILLAPSNPVVSIAAMLSVPGIRDAVSKTQGTVVGVSPFMSGRHTRNVLDICLDTAGMEPSAAALGRHYGSRRLSDDGILDGWLVAAGEKVDIPGVAVQAIPLSMSTSDQTIEVVRTALDLAGAAL